MNDYRRFICLFDKETELLVNKFTFEASLDFLNEIFVHYQNDENLYMAYEIGFKEALEINKIVNIDFNFEKYDYFMEVWSFD
jgi:hypothetical protein